MKKNQHHSDETRKKISDALLGREKSEETRKKMSRSKKGIPSNRLGKLVSAETRKRLSKSLEGSLKGRVYSPEQCERRRDIVNLLYKNRSDYYERICNHNKIFGNKPEERKRRSERMREVWSRPGFINKTATGIKRTEESKIKISDGHIGHWYGSVRYTQTPIYCELWKEVNPRVHAFFDYKCCGCGAPENGHSHIGHHVFYVKGACCWHSEDGIYYTNLNASDHKEDDYCIGENPNYFVILCQSCHGKTNGKFANRKKWADFYRKMIDEQYNGKCYFTKEEMIDYETTTKNKMVQNIGSPINCITQRLDTHFAL